MSQQELVDRLIAINANVSLKELQKRTLTHFEYENVKEWHAKFKKFPLSILDKPRTLKAIRTQIRAIKRQSNLKVVFIDYLQIVSFGKGKFDSRYGEVTAISREMKLLAKEFDIAVVCLSQLSRNIEGREKSSPRLSDLRESGSIEQDADVVGLLKMAGDNPSSDTLLLHIAKNRHGNTGLFAANFVKQRAKILNFKQGERK